MDGRRGKHKFCFLRKFRLLATCVHACVSFNSRRVWLTNLWSLLTFACHRFDPAVGKVFYVDHTTQTTTWTRPIAPTLATAPPPSFQMAASQPSLGMNQNQQLQQQQQHVQQPQQPVNPQASLSQQPFGAQSSFQVPPSQLSYTQPPQQPFGSILPSLQQQQQQQRLSLIEPLWDQKQTGVGCGSCAKEFTFLLRRHRCRCCMREFCANCTVKTAAVPQFGHTMPVRVCDACYSHLSVGRSRCISRLIPYIERDSTTDARRLEALSEVLELLTAGVELMEESRTIGMLPPLLRLALLGNVKVCCVLSCKFRIQFSF
jgi:hypothetical protein